MGITLAHPRCGCIVYLKSASTFAHSAKAYVLSGLRAAFGTPAAGLVSATLTLPIIRHVLGALPFVRAPLTYPTCVPVLACRCKPALAGTPMRLRSEWCGARRVTAHPLPSWW